MRWIVVAIVMAALAAGASGSHFAPSVEVAKSEQVATPHAPLTGNAGLTRPRESAWRVSGVLALGITVVGVARVLEERGRPR